MADVTKNKDTLQLGMRFADEDTRALTLDDPKTTLSGAAMAASINAIGAYIKANDVVIGDKNGADFVRFDSAKIVHSSTTYFDLG